MNFIPHVRLLQNRISKALSRLFWICIKNPLYNLSYNSNGNKFICKGVLTKSSIIIKGNNNSCLIEKGCRLYNTTISITGNNNRLVISDNVIFSEGGRIRIEDEDNTITIGRGCQLINCFLSASDYNTNLSIGEGCLFSANVIIRTSDSHSIMNESENRINPGQDTIKEKNVWIGNGANILKGCVIGDGCVIGTQSVVANLKISDHSVVAGNPARIIKTNIHWDKRRTKSNQ